MAGALTDGVGESRGERKGFRNLRVTWTWTAVVWSLVALGMTLQVWEYAQTRLWYGDEELLLLSIEGQPILEFDRVLPENQLAPPGFLIVERLIARAFGASRLTTRAFPLAMGLIAMIAMGAVSLMWIRREGAALSVGMLALSYEFLYYASELKQYSCDVVLAILALLLPGVRDSRLTGHRAWGLAGLFGLIAPWFSFPIVFVLATIGLRWVASTLAYRRWRELLGLSGLGVLWLVSFGLCYRVARGILDPDGFMEAWWDFAFLPVPPTNLEDARRLLLHILNTFDFPVGFVVPGGKWPSCVVGLTLTLVGAIVLAWRSPGRAWILGAPWAFALIASRLEAYPFHGRLILYLIPSAYLLIGEAVGVTARLIPRRPATWLLPSLLSLAFLAGPVSRVGWHLGVQRLVRGFDSHGDLRPDLLDELEHDELSAEFRASLPDEPPILNDAPVPLPEPDR